MEIETKKKRALYKYLKMILEFSIQELLKLIFKSFLKDVDFEDMKIHICTIIKSLLGIDI